MPPAKPQEDPHWSLDRRIPLALITTVIVSSLGIGSTAVIAHHRLGTVEGRVDRLEASDRQQDRESAVRDRGYAEIMAELRGAVVVLREAVNDLRGTIRRPAP